MSSSRMSYRKNARCPQNSFGPNNRCQSIVVIAEFFIEGVPQETAASQYQYWLTSLLHVCFCLPFVEWGSDYGSRQVVFTDLYPDGGPGLRMGNGDIPYPDPFTQGRGHGTRGDYPIGVPSVSVMVYPCSGFRDPQVQNRPVYGYPGFLLGFKGLAVYKVLGEFCYPAQPGFQGRGGIVDIISIEAIPHLQAEGIPCGQAYGFDPVDAPASSTLSQTCCTSSFLQ